MKNRPHFSTGSPASATSPCPRCEAARILNRGSHDDVEKVGKGCYEVISNHEPGEEVHDEATPGDSFERYLKMDDRAARVAIGDVAGARKALSRWPINHADTVHQMVLVPGSGEMHLRCPHRGEKQYALYRV